MRPNSPHLNSPHLNSPHLNSFSRLRRALAVSAVGVVATLVPAGAATAAPTPSPSEINVQINPSNVRAGARITLFSECASTAASAAFGTVRLRSDEAGYAARVTLRASLRADSYPVTERVYGDQPRAALRLITCDGEFDPIRRSYRNNIVVYASFADYRKGG